MAEPAPQLPQTDSPALATADVNSLAEVAARRAEKFGTMIDTLDAGVAKRAADAAESLARAGFDAKDQQAAADKAAATARREVVANSSDARWERLKELQASADSLAMTAMLWASPVTVLSRPFSSAELADRLVGEEWRQVDTAIRAVREAARRSIIRNREYEAGKVRPLDRVKLALNKPKETN